MIHPIRRILVPLDPSAYTHASTIHACRIAKAHNATVSGLAVFDSPEIRSLLSPSVPSSLPFIESFIKKHSDHAHKKLDLEDEKFRERCTREGVAFSEREVEGMPQELILESAALYDLVVMGLRTFYQFETKNEDGDLLSKVLSRSSTPILAVPKKVKPLKKVLVAYDGSFSAARAARDFLDFSCVLDFEIDLFCCHDDVAQAEFLLNKLESFFEVHSRSIHQKIIRSGSENELVESDFFDPYDLVVCGTHGHRQLSDFFVGSFSKKLIEKNERCLYLSH
ncbi:MAG: universal stress protein [Roseibacillus sp.]